MRAAWHRLRYQMIVMKSEKAYLSLGAAAMDHQAERRRRASWRAVISCRQLRRLRHQEREVADEVALDPSEGRTAKDARAAWACSGLLGAGHRGRHH